MQLTLDTSNTSKREIEALIAFLQAAFNIARADNPETGVVKPPATLTTALAERSLPVPPSLDLPPPPAADPAVVFGSAAVPVPPAPPAAAPAAPVSAMPPASAPPAPPVAGPSAGVELDSSGLPWDVRIHAANRAKNQDGSWRAKRGINDAALVKTVEAELRAVQAIALPPPLTAVAAIAAPQGEQPPVAPPAAVVFGTSAQGELPMPPSAPTDFPSFMTVLTPAMIGGRATQALINEACTAYGVPSLALLATRPDLIPSVYAYLKDRVQI